MAYEKKELTPMWKTDEEQAGTSKWKFFKYH